MKDSIKNLEWRYAVKKFDSEKILSNDKIERLKKAFNLTATSYGLQPIRMVVVQNKELQEKLVASSYGQQQVSQASHVLIICIERVVDKEFIVKYFDRVKNIRNTSESIITPFEDALVSSFSKKDIKEVKDWATNQAYLALGNLLTVCAFEEIDLRGLKNVERISSGYSRHEPPILLKKNCKNLTKVNVAPELEKNRIITLL